MNKQWYESCWFWKYSCPRWWELGWIKNYTKAADAENSLAQDDENSDE